VAGGPVDADSLEYLPAEPDDGRRQGIDCDLEGKDDGSIGIDPNDRRGPAGHALRRGALLEDEIGRGELADERTDRAPGQAGPRDQLGPAGWAAVVELADDGAQVRTADRLTALADGLESHRHLICVPLL
jgi:hypothetical protein